MTLERIADSRMKTVQSGLLAPKVAHVMDAVGNKEVGREFAQTKVVARTRPW